MGHSLCCNHNRVVNLKNTSFQDCFVLWSGGQNGVFAWIGKGATKDERKQAMESAQNLINQKGLPIWTKVNKFSQSDRLDPEPLMVFFYP